MARILSFPFRLEGGQVVVVDPDTEQGISEQIGVLLLTHLQERPLLPSFGITDPTFVGVEPTEVAAGLAEHGPDVALTDVRLTWDTSSTQVVHIDYS